MSYFQDFEVMFDQPSELLSIHYFLEQNRANARSSSKQSSITITQGGGGGIQPISIYHPTSSNTNGGANSTIGYGHYAAQSSEAYKPIPVYKAAENEPKKATIG